MSSLRTAATNVHDGGSSGSPSARATATVSALAAAHAPASADSHGPSRAARAPTGRGDATSTAQASFDAARLARSLSGAVVTPSHTTSTANDGSGIDANAIA